MIIYWKYKSKQLPGVIEIDYANGISYYRNGEQIPCSLTFQALDDHADEITQATKKDSKNHLPQNMTKIKLTEPKQVLLIQPPAKYKIKYKKTNNEVKEYILTILERYPTYFTGYVYGGKGLRSFKDERIINIALA